MFQIVSNRVAGPLAHTDDIENAGRIVHALMISRENPEQEDFWVIAPDGSEFYHCADYKTVFSAKCFA